MQLFVYGTLKRGGRNHRLLADQRFVRGAVTVAGFVLADLGPYPAMVREAGPGVRGEVYAVSECCLGELDDFEGVPDLYTRERVELAGGGEAWAYLYARSVSEGVRRGDEWPIL